MMIVMGNLFAGIKFYFQVLGIKNFISGNHRNSQELLSYEELAM